jgi:hypothetical protein
MSFLPVEAFPQMYRTQNYNNNTTPALSNTTLLEFPLNGTKKKYTDIVPVIKEACAFDYGMIANSTCCSNGPSTKRPCGTESFNLLACSIQSVRTYVSCTTRSEFNVTECVTKTAKRINFVPIGFQVDSVGNKCPTPNETIMHLTRVTIVDFFVFLLFDNPSFFIRLFRRFIRRENIAVRSRTFRVSNLGFWATIAKDVCENVVLVGLVLGKQGYQIDMLKNFVLFTIRPRGAFFHALLGFVDGGWGPDGLIDMIAQILLSIFGGYMALFGAISANHTKDPSRPWWWKTYLAGGAMASIVTDFIWLYLSAIGISVVLICCGGLVALAYLVTIPVVLAWMMLIVAPFKEVWIILRNFINLIRRRTRYADPESLFSFHNVWFSRWYKFTMFISLVLFVGCWMFWNGFLRLSGELYCPKELGWMDATMIGFYAACVLVRKIFGFLLGEKAAIEDIVKEGETDILQELTKLP